MYYSDKYVLLSQIQYTIDKASRVCSEVERGTNTEDRNGKDDDCPVCLESMSRLGKVLPQCGHEICIGCYNRLMTKKCVLCRVNYK